MTDHYSPDSDLLPCPFCGKGKPSIAPILGFGHGANGEGFPAARIECVCGAHGPIMKRENATKSHASEAWNTRAPVNPDVAQVAVTDEIERLRERLGPRGLEVVMIDGAGHYVNEKVKAEIERLRTEPQTAGKCPPDCDCTADCERLDRFGRDPFDNSNSENDDPGSAFVTHNVDDTVTIKVRSPEDRVFSEVEMSLDAWLKLRSVGAPDTSLLSSRIIERCAKLAEQTPLPSYGTNARHTGREEARKKIAAAIRALSRPVCPECQANGLCARHAYALSSQEGK